MRNFGTSFSFPYKLASINGKWGMEGRVPQNTSNIPDPSRFLIRRYIGLIEFQNKTSQPKFTEIRISYVLVEDLTDIEK